MTKREEKKNIVYFFSRGQSRNSRLISSLYKIIRIERNSNRISSHRALYILWLFEGRASPFEQPFPFFLFETVLIGVEVIKRRPPSGNNVAPRDGSAVISNMIELVEFLKPSRLCSACAMIYRVYLASFAFIGTKISFCCLDGI